MSLEEKIKYAKQHYENLGYSGYELKTIRYDDICADLIWIQLRGPGGILIADNGEYLFCQSAHGIEYYIEEFKKGIRTGNFKIEDTNTTK